MNVLAAEYERIMCYSRRKGRDKVPGEHGEIKIGTHSRDA